MSGKAESKPRRARLHTLEQINLDAGGLDIGAEEIWVSVPEDRDSEPVRCFDTFTADLHQLAAWLVECGVTTVAMESTGVYWVPIYEILEAQGIETCLVNAQATKNVSGRKSDVEDCQWIQQLHTYGLLQPSFRPPADICTLRTYVRQREKLLQQRAAHIQQMQNALHLMNVKLTSVIADVTGLTGMQIIRAILDGERDPIMLAQLRDHRCKSSEEEIAKALTGNYQPEHIFTLRQAVEAFDFYTHQLVNCDAELNRHYACFVPQVDMVESPLPDKPKRRQANHPDFDLRTFLYLTSGVDLTAVDGIDVLLAQDIIAEIGTDMSKWKTEKHFASWLGLSPNNRSSAGKIKSRQTKKTKSRANKAFRLAAQSVARTQSAFGAFFRRIKAKHGAPVAITATAHKIARTVYHMLKHRTPYIDPGADAYNEQQRQRSLRHLQRQAKKLGMALVPQT
ncbi:MAG: IS110 family transposase [Caldilineaceae bacterium]